MDTQNYYFLTKSIISICFHYLEYRYNGDDGDLSREPGYAVVSQVNANGMTFATVDNDNGLYDPYTNRNCATDHPGDGWWYNSCGVIFNNIINLSQSVSCMPLCKVGIRCRRLNRSIKSR